MKPSKQSSESWVKYAEEYYEANIGVRKDFVDSIGFSPEEKIGLLRAYDAGLDNLKKMVAQAIKSEIDKARSEERNKLGIIKKGKGFTTIKLNK